ncbi:universal stress protein [Natrialbaceae archaeon AArc-T1-2]|uniref:universal stress protein n=1 Tax=Natrialbaceae archaeon AArc-T1-2 TaxID=3053904 RepID=UPI00255A8CA2|nr:universal stress protein [Natrialbaceae archaeon AArc-T1-2]WIV68730.1 universal stress protein [Natrialbaceae archaeon AArc-T1-2]
MFRVLLPVDTGEERALKSAEAVVSLPESTEKVEVTILNVQPNVNVSDGEGHADSSDWYDEDDFPDSMEQTKDYLESNGVSVNLRREHANPSEIIVDIAEEIKADRIVMSGRKRTPVGKVLFGSTTQSVLLNSDIPVTVTMK